MRDSRPRSNDPRKQLLAGLPITERRLDLAGVSTAIVDAGDGDPVVLLHGPMEHAAKWWRVLPRLARSHHVIAPDLPGHGASSAPDDLDAGRVLDWLAELVERTCSSPPSLVGQIIGGAIAARFAAERGVRIRALVLADTLGLVDFHPAPEFGAALSAYLEGPGGETHDALWRRCAFDLDRLRDEIGEDWESLKAYGLDRARAPGLADAQRRLMELFGFPAIPEETLARIDVPTTLIWGRHDLATRLEIAEAASKRHGWPLLVIDGAADDPAIERPDAFVDAVRTALVAADTSAGARAAWDRIASGYDEIVTPSHLELAQEGLRRAGLAPGMRFLDVACGSGALSLPAARLGARVTAVDLSPRMVERLEARARDEGLDIEARVMDGHALAFDDDTFDMAGSQWGVMLFPDFSRGLRELARVTRPGGRVLLHVFGPVEEVQFFTVFMAAMRAAVPGFQGVPIDPAPLPFQVSDPRKLRHEFVRAGLTDVTIDTVTESLTFESGEAMWRWLMNSNPIPGAIVAGLSPEQLRGVIGELDAAIRARAGVGGAARLTNAVHIAIGTR